MPVTSHSRPVAAQTIAVAVCIALASAAGLVREQRAHRAEPPSVDDAGAWQWVSTLPGTNVFMHEVADPHSPSHAKAWVEFRFLRSPVSVDAYVVELWEFDCLRRRSRRVSSPFRGSPSNDITRSREDARVSPWRRDPTDSTPGRILSRICDTADSSNLTQ